MYRSLVELRAQIDTVDRSIICSLLYSRERVDCLDAVIELTPEDKASLRSTRFYFSQNVCELLWQRMYISRQIGAVKRTEWKTEMLDEARKNIMIQSRVSWAPESHQRLVQQFFELLHDISVRVQEEWKNLQK